MFYHGIALQGIARLHKEYERAMTSKVCRLINIGSFCHSHQDFDAILVDHDLFLWEVQIPFDETSALGRDLRKFTGGK